MSHPNDMFVKFWPPKDGGKNTFRLEVGMENGECPSPASSIFLAIKTLIKIADDTKCGMPGKEIAYRAIHANLEIREEIEQ